MAKRKSSRSSSSSSSEKGRRSRTRERREQREKEKQRQQQIVIIIGVVVAAIVIAGLLIVANQPADAPVPEDLVARYENIPQTQTDEGYFRLGRPDAPVRVEEFSSFSCPGCEQFFSANMDSLVELVRTGAISFTFVPQVTGSLLNAEGAARAAICAGEQGLFFEYHDMLFDWHTRFGNQAFSQNRLRSGAENIGLDVDTFNDCATSGRSGDIVDSGVNEGVSRSIPGTPSTYVNGSPVTSNFTAINDAVQSELREIGATLNPIPAGNADDEDAETSSEDADVEDTDSESESTPEPDDTEDTSSEDEPEAESTEEASD